MPVPRLPFFSIFAKARSTSLTVNGVRIPAKIENGHIVLPAGAIHSGENTVSVDFTAPVAPAGRAITRFEDKDDHTEYLYTLFVPMDAEMAFPCFDQPDLKGRFRLELTAPEDLDGHIQHAHRIAIAYRVRPACHDVFGNSSNQHVSLRFRRRPFPQEFTRTDGLPGLYVRQSQLKKAEAEAPEVQQTAAKGIEYLSRFFAQPFPFPKYDMVLIPGFAYGGMEHAGATFLREESVLVPHRSNA